MFRIDSATASVSLPTPEAVGPKPNAYFDGNTIPTDDWENAIQEEICYVITQDSIALSKTNRGQLLAAVVDLVNLGPTRIGITAVVQDTAPVQGGNLDVNGHSMITSSNRDFTITPNGTGIINLNCDSVLVNNNIQHAGDLNTKVSFVSNEQDYNTGGTTRFNVTNSGFQIGTGAILTGILNENDFISNSDVSTYTQSSLKAVVDNLYTKLFGGQPISMCITNGTSGGTFNGWGYNFSTSGSPGDIYGIASRACTIHNLYAQGLFSDTGHAFDANAVITLYKNGVATSLTCTITPNGVNDSPVQASDTTHSVTFAAGDKMSFHIVFGSGTYIPAISLTVLIQK